MVCRLIDFAFVALKLFMFIVCGIICMSKWDLSIFPALKGLKRIKKNKLKITQNLLSL